MTIFSIMKLRFVVLIVLHCCAFSRIPNSSASALPTTTDSLYYYESTEPVPEATTIIYEELPRSLGSEAGSPDSSTVEQTTILPVPSPFQAEVLNELEDLWNFSEGLDESQSDLKTSLTSLVHLSYGRLQTEPEETLDRLKYMLRKLREKLTQNQTTHEEHNHPSRSKRSILDDMDEIFGIGEVENVLDPIEYIQAFNRNSTTKYFHEQRPTTSLPPQPQEATIQKVIRVEGDRINNGPPATTDSPLFGHISEFLLTHATQTGQLHRTTTGSPAVTVTAEQIADSILKLLNKNYHHGLASTIPVTLPTTPSPYPTPTPAQTTYPTNYMIPIVSLPEVHKHSSISPDVSQSILYFQQYMKKLRKKQKQREKLKQAMKLYNHLKTTTTPLPLPSYFQNSHNYFIQHSQPDTDTDNELEESLTSVAILQQPLKPESTPPRHAPTTIPSKIRSTTSKLSSPAADYDFLLESTDIADTDAAATVPASSEVLTPALTHILEELAATSVVLTPALFLNGTREGFTAFVSGFNGLTFSTKMVLLFILSVSVLSIALGIYSLGPPIIAVGALGILIPIMLLVLLQQADEKRRAELKGDGLGIKKVDNLETVLDLVSDAIKKYSDDS